MKGLHGRAGQRVALQETAEAKADPSLVSKFRSGSIFAVGGLETVGSLRKDKLRVRILPSFPAVLFDALPLPFTTGYSYSMRADL